MAFGPGRLEPEEPRTLLDMARRPTSVYARRSDALNTPAARGPAAAPISAADEVERLA